MTDQQPQIGTTHCPDPSCRAPMVRRRSRFGKREERYVCSNRLCPETLGISERERMIAAGAPFLPGFE